MSAPEQKDPLTPEQARLLAQVGAADAGLVVAEVPHDAEGNPLPPAEPVDKVAGNAELLNFLITAASPALPFLPLAYTPEVIKNIAGAFTAVEEKYGWNIGGAIGPEVALAIFAVPPTVAAYQMGKMYFADQREKREAAEKGKPESKPGGGLEGATAGALGGG